MPFTCGVCGGRNWPDLIPAVGDVLRCTHCADERAFVRPPLLIVTGAAGTGKSTLCARLAGTVPGAIFLDADIFAENHVSLVPPYEDYPSFWRSMMQLAHEIAQSHAVVVFFSTMLPDQVLQNREVLGYFSSTDFLCLTCTPAVLQSRLSRRDGEVASAERIQFWLDFNEALLAQSAEIATVVGADGTPHEVEHAARRWINETLRAGERPA